MIVLSRRKLQWRNSPISTATISATINAITAKYPPIKRCITRSGIFTHTAASIINQGITDIYPAVVESSRRPCHTTPISSDIEASAARSAYHKRNMGFCRAISRSVMRKRTVMVIILGNILLIIYNVAKIGILTLKIRNWRLQFWCIPPAARNKLSL